MLETVFVSDWSFVVHRAGLDVQLWALAKSGGWLMIPILVCSVIALAICLERAFVLRKSRVAPAGLLDHIGDSMRQQGFVDNSLLAEVEQHPLGIVLAAGLREWEVGPDAAQNAMEQAASQVTFELERHLTALGVVASISPLLGLLGTVVGMIQVFTTLVVTGGGDPTTLAGGISTALITTAFGISVAIIAIACHRYFLRRVDKLVIELEKDAGSLINLLHRDFALERSA